MCRCLLEKDMTRLSLLWSAARSVTLTCFVVKDPKDLLFRSLHASEDYQKLGELTDSWVHWARKVNALLAGVAGKKAAEQEAWLAQKHVAYRGSPISKGLLNAVFAMRRFNDDALTILRKIEKQFGMEVFSTGYVKLTRLSQLAAGLPAAVPQLTFVSM